MKRSEIHARHRIPNPTADPLLHQANKKTKYKAANHLLISAMTRATTPTQAQQVHRAKERTARKIQTLLQNPLPPQQQTDQECLKPRNQLSEASSPSTIFCLKPYLQCTTPPTKATASLILSLQAWAIYWSITQVHTISADFLNRARLFKLSATMWLCATSSSTT